MGNSVFFMVMVFIIIAVVGKGYLEGKKKERKIEKELVNQWKERREKVFSPYDMEQISYLSEREKGKNYVDDLTWDNLEMDRVYEKICYCHSTVGEEYFYHMLRNPIRDREELQALESKISCFWGEDPPVLLQKELIMLGKIKKYSMQEYLDFLMQQEKKSNFVHYLGISILAASFLFMYYHLFAGILLFFIVLLFQIISYFRIRAKIGPYMMSLRYLFKLLDRSEKIITKLPKEWQEERKILEQLLKDLGKVRRNAFLVLSHGSMWGQGLELILDYLRMILHPDIIKYHLILEELKRKEKELRFLYQTIGKLDACIAIAAYRNTLAYWTSPMEKEGERLEILEGYHPLLADPVANSLKLTKGLLLTGSNASGKSTFLKMIGVNILLAQAINTVHAKKLYLPCCRVMTCLSVKDSLLLSESYYVAEIKAVKNIFEQAEAGEKIICLVDELLRGTNTMERIAAGAEILRQMRQKGMVVLAATHDRELTEILDNDFENYHFKEAISGKELHFSYHLLPGRADTTNAIFLLNHMGYDAKIVEGARKRLEKFQKEGVWV